MTKRFFMIFLASVMMAGCAKEVAPQQDVIPEETVEISVTLPEVELIQTRASLAENGKGGFTPSWTEGDQILVGGEVFSMVSVQGMTAKFTGKMPDGNIFDII